MADEEINDELFNQKIKEEARATILNVCESLRLGNAKDLEVTETENGEIEFHFVHSSNQGRIDIRYSPHLFVEGLLKTLDKTMKSRMGSEVWKNVPSELAQELIQHDALGITRGILSHLPYECSAFMYDLAELGIGTYAFLRFEEEILHRTKAQRKEEINRLLERLNERRKTIILSFESQQIASVSAPDFIFCDIYDSHLAVWKKAKTFYKTNKEFSNNLEITKTAFPQLDEGLINKFALKGEGEPSALAFESTSRHLNIPPEKGASESSRKRYLADSRTQRKSASDEEAETAYQKFISARQRNDEANARRNKMVGDFMDTTVSKTGNHSGSNLNSILNPQPVI